MAGNFAITVAGPSAAELLAALQSASFDGECWTAGSWSTLLHQPGVVAHVAQPPNDDPVGMLLTRVIANQAEVLTVGVLPPFRRRGVARALMAEFLRVCRHDAVTEVALEVAADNPVAAAFYKSLGFRPAGRRRNYYKTRAGTAVDAAIMVLDVHARSSVTGYTGSR